MAYLALIDGEVSVSVSADDAIRPKLASLTDKARKNVQLLTAQEWCLMTILRKAHDGLAAGTTTINLRKLCDYMVSMYGDEGTAKWQEAFDAATVDALALFTPHPDSLA